MKRENFLCVVKERRFHLLGGTEAHTVISQSQGKGAREAGEENKVSWSENSVLSLDLFCANLGWLSFVLLQKNLPK